MILSAEYADRRACPACGSPARKLMRSWVEEGEWVYKPAPVAMAERRFRPDYHAERWHNHPVKRFDEKSHTVREEDRWLLVATHMCMAFLTGKECAHELLQDLDTTDYRGEEYEWMAAPVSLMSMDVSAVAKKWTADRKTLSAGDA